MYILYYNKDCKDCEKQAQRTASLDWLKRFEISTEVPPCGELELGEIAVIDKRNQKIYTGGYASRVICLNVPAYYPIGLLMYLPPIFKLFDRGKHGCNGDSCALTTRT